MAITTIDLMRHGEPVGGNKYRGYLDDPLSEKGWQQMREAVGERCPWDVIVTSKLFRCADFARELAARHQLPVIVDDRLIEIGFGVWEGKTAAELTRDDAGLLLRFWADPLNNSPRDAEPLPLFKTRVMAAWQALLQDHSGKRVLVITHAGTIRLLLSHVLDMPLGRLFRIAVPNAGLSRIRIETGPDGQIFPQLIFHAGVLPV